MRSIRSVRLFYDRMLCYILSRYNYYCYDYVILCSCYAVLNFVKLYYVMVTIDYVILCSCYAALYFVTLYYVMTMLFFVVQCREMLCYVMQYYVMQCYVALCYAMSVSQSLVVFVWLFLILPCSFKRVIEAPHKTANRLTIRLYIFRKFLITVLCYVASYIYIYNI